MVKVEGRVALLLFIVAIALLVYFWPTINSGFRGPTCDGLESGFYSMINQSNYCTQDSDCIILDTGCQLGCYGFVNKNSNMNQLLSLSSGFVKAGCGVCNKACIQPPRQEDIICSGGKCGIKE